DPLLVCGNQPVLPPRNKESPNTVFSSNATIFSCFGLNIIWLWVHKEDRPGWAIPREADVPVPSPAESSRETREAEAPGIRRLGKHDSSSDDGSMAAGGVIIGGLVTVFFAAVFAYIRVTRKKDDVQVQH
ncbi:hypothetical protein V6Z12_D02G218700, partial [Gossypium hirsutum]